MAGDSTTIARPYAEAAFEVAQEHKALDPWSDALSTLAMIVEDPQIASQVGNPNLPGDTLRDLVFGIIGDGLTNEMQGLVRLLAANKRLIVLPDIARLFNQMKTAAEGLSKVQITSAFAVDEAEQAALAAKLNTYLGCEVELSIEQDAELIGGVIIRAGDVVIDGSIRGKLDQLSNELQF